MMRHLRIMLVLGFICGCCLSLVAQPLSGDYSVGGASPDFVTPGEAIDTLLANGVAGPVTFHIRSGIYESAGGSERAFHLPDTIPGASGSRIVTFRADAASGATADSVVFRRRGGVNEFGWVAWIRADFVTLENLTFEYANDDTTLAGVNTNQDNVRFTPIQGSGGNASSDSITVRGCRFVSSGASRPFRGLFFTSGGNTITIEDNYIRRVGDGIWLERCNGCAPFDNVTIHGNVIERLSTYSGVTGDWYGKGIYLSNGFGYTITGNEIELEGGATAINGIQVIGGDVVIDGNRLRGAAFQQFSFDRFWGLFLRLYGTRNRVSNNLVSHIRKHAIGIHLENSANVHVYHNTVALAPTRDFLQLTGLELQNCTGIDVRNNIFVTRTATGVTNRSIHGIGTNTGLAFDSNILFSEPFRIEFDGVTYDSLAAWQAAGFGAGSRSFLPEFIDAWPYNDARLGDCARGDIRFFGEPLPEVPTDFDGETRSSTAPTIGADEVSGTRPDIVQPVMRFPAGDNPIFLAGGDLDNDADRDIVVINNFVGSGSGDVLLLRNDGSGSFAAPELLPFTTEPVTARIDDLDRDGVNDLLVLSTDSLWLAWGKPDGNLEPPVTLPYDPALGPVTGIDLAYRPDSSLWLMFQTHFGTVGVDSGWVSLLFYDRIARNFFYRGKNYARPRRAGMHPEEVRAIHLNGDDLVDYVVSDWVTGKVTSMVNMGYDTLNVWRGYQRLQEVAVIGGSTTIHPNMEVGDIDGDGDPDILLGKWDTPVDSLVFLENIGSGSGSLRVERLGLDPRRPSHTFAVLDYERDGDADLVSATSRNDLVLYRNDGFGEMEILRLCRDSFLDGLPYAIISADFNGDQLPDIAAITSGDSVSVMVNANYTTGTGEPESRGIGETAKTFTLEQNYPNPFNPSTTIRFAVTDFQVRRQKSEGRSGMTPGVQLVVYDLLGRTVATLVDEPMAPGWHEVVWDGRNDRGVSVASGVYLYRLQTGSFVQTRKMVLMR